MYTCTVKGAQRLVSVETDSADTQVVQSASVYISYAVELVVRANFISARDEMIEDKHLRLLLLYTSYMVRQSGR